MTELNAKQCKYKSEKPRMPLSEPLRTPIKKPMPDHMIIRIGNTAACTEDIVRAVEQYHGVA